MDTNIKERFLKNGRWFVRLHESLNGRSVMPQYVYVWLKTNPSFEEVPQGYAIHHLDEDKLNDDPTNLALMQRYFHTAHHFKHKIVEPKINIRLSEYYNERVNYKPRSRPYICKRSDTNRYFVKIVEDTDGGIKTTKVGSFNGKKFLTREDAEMFVSLIWDKAA